jgi:virulence-associated protein VagC
MQAIEFESILHNGQLRIPKHHQNWEGRHVKVILLTDEPPTEQKADTVFKLLSDLSDDFMEQGRQQLPVQMRDDY